MFEEGLGILKRALSGECFSHSGKYGIAERWVRSVRSECLDHVFVFNERHLQKVLTEYVGYFNRWRPHRSIGQRAPCASVPLPPYRHAQAARIVAIPVLGGLLHVYQHAA